MSQKTWKLSIPSKPAKIVDVEEFINHIFAEEKWDEDVQANIGIALTEIVNNAILHGNKSDHNKSVDITINADDEYIEMLVSDEGKSAEDIGIPDPTQPENLLKTDGRGLFLVKHFMDEVKLIPSDSGTTVSMKLKLTG